MTGPSASGDFGSHEPRSRSRRRAVIALSACLSILLTGSGAAWGYDRAQVDVLPRGTRVAGVDVGGLSADRAVVRLSAQVTSPLRLPVSLKVGSVERTATPWELGLRFDDEGAVSQALNGHRSASLPGRVWTLLTGSGGAVETEPAVDEEVLGQVVRDLTTELDSEPTDARLDIEDGWVKVVPAVRGQRIDPDTAAASIRDGLVARSSSIDIPIETIEPAVGDDAFSSVILIRRGERRLHHYVGGEIARTYPIAVGKAGYATPAGVFSVTAKRRNPSWGNPGSAWARGMPKVIPPGPRNPLGTRAINISARGIRIHGTPDAGSIGRAASHGCIRMLRHDVEELFEKVEVGIPVVITA